MKKLNLIEEEIDFYLDLYLGEILKECECDASDYNEVVTGEEPDDVPETLDDIEDDLGGKLSYFGDIEDDEPNEFFDVNEDYELNEDDEVDEGVLGDFIDSLKYSLSPSWKKAAKDAANQRILKGAQRVGRQVAAIR